MGSGLGLYFVRSIIETMNGKVSAQGRAGGGLIVTVSLPLALQGDARWAHS